MTEKPTISSRPFILRVVLLLVLTGSGCENRKLYGPTAPAVLTERKIRVLLFDNIRTCRLEFQNDFSLLNADDGTSTPFTGQHAVFNVTAAGGKIVIGKSVFGKEVHIKPEMPRVFSVNGEWYRGAVTIKASAGGDGFDIVNVLPVEFYLAGVVSAEMPYYWEPEALKAQAICCRTYCLYISTKHGVNRHWDLRKTQSHQVYGGLASERATTSEAVTATTGQVLVAQGSSDISGIFPAYFSSSCGGHTENSANVFGDSFTPLEGVYCGYCKAVAKPQLYAWPSVEFEAGKITSQLVKRYPETTAIGKISTIEAQRSSTYDDITRITSLKLVGNKGRSMYLRAEDFRLAVDPSGQMIKSTSFNILKKGDVFVFSDGRGFGHGVGFCQCGAEGLARRGANCRQILQYYYPHSKLLKIY